MNDVDFEVLTKHVRCRSVGRIGFRCMLPSGHKGFHEYIQTFNWRDFPTKKRKEVFRGEDKL